MTYALIDSCNWWTLPLSLLFQVFVLKTILQKSIASFGKGRNASELSRVILISALQTINIDGEVHFYDEDNLELQENVSRACTEDERSFLPKHPKLWEFAPEFMHCGIKNDVL